MAVLPEAAGRLSGWGRCFRGVSVAVTAVVALYLIGSVLRMLMLPSPQECRETAVLMTTDVLLRGENPFDLAHQPMYVNIYGVLYWLVVYPLAWLFGSTFTVHRGVSLACLAGACLMFFRTLRWQAASWWLALVATGMFWRFQGQSMTILARPDGLGLLLFLGAILVAWRSGYSWLGLAASAALGVLALWAKAYFGMALPVVGLYLFLYRGKSQALLYGLGALGLAIASGLLLNRLFPYYFFNTLTGPAILNAGSSRSVVMLLRQYACFCGLHGGLLIVLAVAARCALPKPGAQRGIFAPFNLHGPLLRGEGDVMVVGILCGAAVLVYPLGLNDGTWMLYFYHLLSPFVIFVACRWISRHASARTWALAALAANSILMIIIIKPLPFPKSHREQWAYWDGLIGSHRRVFASPMLAQILRQQGRNIYDSGYPEFMICGMRKAGPGHYPLAIINRYAEYSADIRSRLEQENFDLVILAMGGDDMVDPGLLNAHYVHRERIAIRGYWRAYWYNIWVPRHAAMSLGSGPSATQPTGP